jgi:hypothetical protein
VATTATFEVGRPPGTKPGVVVQMPVAVPFGVFELAPGESYEVRLSIDDESRDAWRLPFVVREAPVQQA